MNVFRHEQRLPLVVGQQPALNMVMGSIEEISGLTGRIGRKQNPNGCFVSLTNSSWLYPVKTRAKKMSVVAKLETVHDCLAKSSRLMHRHPKIIKEIAECYNALM